MGLGDVGRGDELVPRGHVALARVVLHDAADGPALRMEHGEAGADLLGEGEEVELGAEPAVVPSLRLLQSVEVLGERLLRLPGRAVDPLQLFTLLVPPPVRARHPHQREVAEPACRRDVRTSTEIGEGRRVPVRRDLRGGRVAGGCVDLVPSGRDRFDDLALERLVLEERETLVDRVLVADEGLVLGDDLAHGRRDPLEVVVAEVGPPGQLEVVVEAVLDHRPDGELGAGPESQDRLRQHMGGGMADDLAPGRRLDGDHAHLRAVGQRRREVDRDPVESGGHGCGGKSRADRGGQLPGGRPLVELPGRAIGKSDGDRCHGCAFRSRRG